MQLHSGTGWKKSYAAGHSGEREKGRKGRKQVLFLFFQLCFNGRFAKRKLDDFNFLGNLLQVNYAPMYESVLDTKDKLEERRSVLLSRIRCKIFLHPFFCTKDIFAWFSNK